MAANPIPMLPVYERRPRRPEGNALGDFGASGPVALLRSGRLAQLEALRGVPRRHGAVLVPSYHCLSMIEPVTAIASTPVFYRLMPTLAPDLEHIAAHIERVDAVVAVHYFGVPQDFRALRTLCDEHGVALVEDCAHTLFGPVGGTGDFAIGSLRKFYPLFDGGAVRCNRDHAVVPGRRAWTYELKALKNTLETASEFGRLGAGPGNPAAIHVPELPAHPVPVPAAESGGYVDPRYHPSLSLAPMSLMAKRQLAGVNVPEVQARRRQIMQRLHEACGSLGHMQPFLTDPSAAPVPYVFLLRLARPADDFGRLKRLGMPIWRWDALATDICEVSNDLRESLLQLPCHQGLRDDEVERMCGWLQDVDTS